MANLCPPPPFCGHFVEVENNNLNGGVERYEELAKAMENAPPLEIMDKALEKFGNDIAIAFR